MLVEAHEECMETQRVMLPEETSLLKAASAGTRVRPRPPSSPSSLPPAAPVPACSCLPRVPLGSPPVPSAAQPLAALQPACGCARRVLGARRTTTWRRTSRSSTLSWPRRSRPSRMYAASPSTLPPRAGPVTSASPIRRHRRRALVCVCVCACVCGAGAGARGGGGNSRGSFLLRLGSRLDLVWPDFRSTPCPCSAPSASSCTSA